MDPTQVSVVGAIANLSAVGILGYWLIYGLPATLKQLSDSNEREMARLVESHSAERQQFRDQITRLAESLDNLAGAMPSVCRGEGFAGRGTRGHPPS